MLHLDEPRRRAVLGTFLGAADADGGPTPEQAALLGAVGHHLLLLDPAEVTPLGPDEAAAALGGTEDARLVTEGLVVLELTRHPPSAVLTDRVQAYLTALHDDGGSQRLARDYVAAAVDRVATDYERVAGPRQDTPDDVALAASGEGEGAALAHRLDALAGCPPGSLGRSYHDFTTRHHLPWPDHTTLVAHDFTHVLAGYEAVPEGEIALVAMLAAATGGGHHWSGLLASLLLFEVGMLPFGDIVPKEGVLGRPGAAELFGDALARGARCGTDFHALDHLALADRDLVGLRQELRIPAPPEGPFTFVV